MIRPATMDDILRVSVNMRADDYAEVMATRWDNSPLAFGVDHSRLNGVKYAAIASDGEPVAVGGVAVHQPCVGQAWMIGTPRITECRRELARFCAKLMRETIAGDLHRIQAFSAANHTMVHRWLKKTGFTAEAKLRGYGKRGETFIVFSITKQEDSPCA